MTTEIQKTTPNVSLAAETLGEMRELANVLIRSGMCPRQYVGKPNEALIAIRAGRRFGFDALQSLCGIAVIGQRPCLWGDSRAAVVLDSGKAEWIKEWYEVDGKTETPSGRYAKLDDIPNGLAACWQCKRRDQTEASRVVRFSVADAKMSRLWKKQGPWTDYPLRMLQMRARATGENDHFADATHGMGQVEEMTDVARRQGKGPLEESVAVETRAVAPDDDVHEGEVERVVGEVMEQPSEPENASVEPVTTADKRALIAHVKTKIAESGASDAMPAADLIAEALRKGLGLPGLTKRADLDTVRDLFDAGRVDYATGDVLPE